MTLYIKTVDAKRFDTLTDPDEMTAWIQVRVPTANPEFMVVDNGNQHMEVIVFECRKHSAHMLPRGGWAVFSDGRMEVMRDEDFIVTYSPADWVELVD